MNRIIKILIGVVVVGIAIYQLTISQFISNTDSKMNQLFETELKTYKEYTKEDIVDDIGYDVIDIECVQEEPVILSLKHDMPAQLELSHIRLTNKSTPQQSYVQLTYNAKLITPHDRSDSYIIKYLILNEDDEIMQMGTFKESFEEVNEAIQCEEALMNLNALHQYKFMFVE